MKVLIILAALLASPISYADDSPPENKDNIEGNQSQVIIPKCEQPPFGEKSKDYKETTELFTKKSPIGGIPLENLKKLLSFSYKQSCYVKSNGNNQDKFLSLGLSADDISKRSITSLAITYFSKATSVYIGTYVLQAKTITVKDFAIDGPALASKKDIVEISGWYAGENDSLYSNYNDFLLVKYSNIFRPSAPLLLDSASRNLREKLLSCKTNISQQGCQITIKGVALICDVSNAYGAAHQEPCINAGSEPNEGISYLPN